MESGWHQRKKWISDLRPKRPHARLHAFKCPWYGIWKEKGLLDYGKYFCKEIDSALVRGFNPDLELEVKSTRTTGGQYCDFIFKDADLSLMKIVKLLYKKKIHPGKAVIMPWGLSFRPSV